ncbi:hypothetical protein [Mesorhizobium sp. KR9-304]|uniref:hypothetical protein n=1 Tax=Mesorhizobium sp. KR9-304 TaxID=3156614 RepID=UPI0032B52ED7
MAKPRCQIYMQVDPKVHENLARRAKAKGMSVTGYAQLLFEAAYAARIERERENPASDAELDRQVRAVFCLAGEFDAATIAKALGVPKTFVDKVLAGWTKTGRAA